MADKQYLLVLNDKHLKRVSEIFGEQMTVIQVMGMDLPGPHRILVTPKPGQTIDNQELMKPPNNGVQFI